MNLEHQQECISTINRQNQAAVNHWLMMEWERAHLSLEI